MSQTMNQKPAKKKTKSKAPFVEEPEELSGSEKIFEAISPHLTTIGLVVLAGLLAFVAIAFMIQSSFDKKAVEWRDLANSSAIALRSGDISNLKAVANSYPDSKAGLWALQMAGDQQLRMGIEQLSSDRDGGIQLIKKSKENFQSIVDSPQTLKTTMLDRRSHFSLAYAHESLGEFADAKKIYDKLVEQAPDSAFADPARRGSKRSSNEKYALLYEKFVNFEEDVLGDAPGPSIPDRPNISFDANDLEPGLKPPTENSGEEVNNDFQPPKESENVKPEKSATDDPVAGTESVDKAVDDAEIDAPPQPKKDDK